MLMIGYSRHGPRKLFAQPDPSVVCAEGYTDCQWASVDAYRGEMVCYKAWDLFDAALSKLAKSFITHKVALEEWDDCPWQLPSYGDSGNTPRVVHNTLHCLNRSCNKIESV